ncbi:YibE/F family protein [Couchioplanes caeruleus]|uniref:YibE/F family protein n=1 Tax=Couchioplanes caeruleus TaxID=56438 RepID=UPI0020BFFD61|nr:YibE/F family protein [Couchioplanes caeruleus]UQU67485.1 YibE/F family protein [Couchioplanes caeruleus]
MLATAIGMLLPWPHDAPRSAEVADGPIEVTAEVRTVKPAPCPPTPEGQEQPGQVCGVVTVVVTSGADKGTQITTDAPTGPGAQPVSAGDDITLLVLQNEDGGTSYSIADFQRSRELWVLGAAFALAVVAFGRWRGLTALAGLAITFAVLLLFIVPAILDGRSPVAVAVVGAAAIMLVVLYLTHGLGRTTTIAVAGTLASLTITALLSALATAGVHLSGVADETSNYVSITQTDVNMRGLLLAGIVIGALGVLDDVTVTQSVTVTELALANPAYRFRQLYAAATRVGRAHIASVINTIVLAYAGASLPLMLLFAAGNSPVSELLTGELIAQELVRSAVGTIGLIAAVPITTALAALVAARSAHGAEPNPAPPAKRPAKDPWTAFISDDRS